MNLPHTPADILRYALIASSGGSLPSVNGVWPIYISNEPDLPDNCITIYDTAGKFQGRIQVTGEMVEYPGIQIRVRGIDHQTARTRALLIENILDTVFRRTLVTIGLNTYMVEAVTRTSQTIDAGKAVSQSKRHLFTLNAVLTLTMI
jgi:hypothetical protein